MPTYTPPPTPMTYKAPEQANIGAGIAQLGSQLQQAGTELKGVYDREQFKQVRAQSIAKLKEQFGAKFQLPLGEQYITPEQFATGMKNLTRGLATYETVKAKSPNRVLPDPGDFATIMFNGSDQDANKVISSLDAMLGEEDKAARDKADSETMASALASVKKPSTAEEANYAIATTKDIPVSAETRSKSFPLGALSEKTRLDYEAKKAAIEQRAKAAGLRYKAALSKLANDEKNTIVNQLKVIKDVIQASGDPDKTIQQSERLAASFERDAERLNSKTPGAGDYLLSRASDIRETLYAPDNVLARTQKRDILANIMNMAEQDIGMAPTPVPGDTGTGAPKPLKAGKGKEEWITLPSGKRVKKIK